MNNASHSARFLTASAIGCAFALLGTQIGCEPAGNGVAPREPERRETAPPPPPPRDPYEDPYGEPMTDPGQDGPGTQ